VHGHIFGDERGKDGQTVSNNTSRQGGSQRFAAESSKQKRGVPPFQTDSKSRAKHRLVLHQIATTTATVATLVDGENSHETPALWGESFAVLWAVAYENLP
jgi:hypothetical protein